MKTSAMLRHTLLTCAALVFIFPVLVMISTSLKPLAEINEGSLFALPREPTLEPWLKAWGTACLSGACRGISGSFANSLAIVIPSVIGSLVVGGVTGFAMSLRLSRLADWLLKAVLIGLFIPIQVTLFPLIILIRELGLFGTRTGIILVHVLWGMPFVCLLLRNHFLTVPRSLIHAARIDGAGFLDILRHVILPQSLPICGVALALQFTFIWNEFLLGLTFAGPGNEPITVALSVLTGAQYGVQEYNVNMAATLLAALPTLAIYLLYGKIFLRGVTTGSTND